MESREEEALDETDTYLRTCLTPTSTDRLLPSRAFRYLFLKGQAVSKVGVSALYEYLPMERRGKFCCSNEKLNQIWEISAYTFHLNSREFFLDGIKRDRWVWSGDAYQSYFINRYLFFDKEITKRTILALRGKDPVESHINTILDYSFYWVMSIYDYYMTFGDVNFLKQLYPKMESLMEFCLSRLDENGFIDQMENDWVFIDWADMDKEGPVCAEQMLLLKSLETMVYCSKILGYKWESYQRIADQLKERLDQYYWKEEKGAFIDSFLSGRRSCYETC